MTTMLLTLALLGHRPVAFQRGPLSFYWVGYEVGPASIGASVAGPTAVGSNDTFTHSVTMTDSDTLVKSNSSTATQVFGESKLLSLELGSNNGRVNGNPSSIVFQVDHIDTPTFTDGSVVKDVVYKAIKVDALTYPVELTCSYIVTDPADAYAAEIPWSGHTMDTPGVTVTKTVTVSG